MWKYTLALTFLTASGHAAQANTPPVDTPLPPLLPTKTPIQSYMMITPASRALDFQQAFEQMRKEKTTGKVYFQLADGSTISNIIDMTLMTHSTLVLFRFNSNQGIRYQVVRVEDLVNLYY